MTENEARPRRSVSNVVLQVAAALALGGALVVGFIGLQSSAEPAGVDSAGCPAPKPGDAPEFPALCAALVRADLPELFGTPKQRVSTPQAGSPITLGDGTKVDDASAEVQVGSYRVRLTDSRLIPLSLAGSLTGGSNRPTTLLGHRAVTYSEPTMAISLNLFGGKASAGPGGVARHLAVVKSQMPDSGTYELVIWRDDSATPDDAALLRIAEQVVPTLPDWVAAP